MSEIENAGDGVRRRNAQEWAQRLKQFDACGQQAKGGVVRALAVQAS